METSNNVLNPLNTKFVVWDAMMSSGKTQRIIKTMITEHKPLGYFGATPEKFMYISPYLDEAHRIAGTTPITGDDAKRPKLDAKGKVIYLDVPQKDLQFCHPSNSNKDGSKQTGLKYLIENSANIVSTHTLFKSLSCLDVPNIENYTLVIDESLEVLEYDLTFTNAEIEQYFKINLLSLDADGKTVRFHKENFGRAGKGVDSTENTQYEQFANDCTKGLVYKVKKRLIRKFDATLLYKFKRVIIMTYNYKGSMFDLILQQAGINPEIEYFGKTVKDVKPLIKINMDEKMNAVGVARNPKNMVKDAKYPTLTSTYFKADAEGKKVAYPEINKFFYNKLYNMWLQREKVAVERRLWTCFKPDMMEISKGTGKTNRFSSQWLAYNTKATNDYDQTDHLAFLVNAYITPDFLLVLTWNGIKFNQDHYALNILIQWIFRSAIRQKTPKEIDVYIPSERMRTLLIDWLNGEVVTYAKKED